MARTVSPAMAPYIELSRRMKGRPWDEIQAARRELKRQLDGESRRRNPSPARRRNPGGSGLLLPLALAGGAWYLWKRHGHPSTATATAPGPMATPTATSVGL